VSRAWGSRLTLAAALLASCARNPATGERQLMLVDERGEIRIGHDADREVTARLGLVEDPSLQAYVSRVGRRLAATTERPELPWSFRVVDDAAVNAFALPGGYVYVTRGLLAHLNSEAELAAVLGHEIGHVTARHSTSRASQARMAALGLGFGALLVPHVARNLDLAESGLSLVMLKFGRDDEREADALGVRYLARSEYATAGVLHVLEMLGRVEASLAPGVPFDWLSTHPSADGRARRVEPLVRAGGREARAAYLRAIDGLVYGADPRAGFLRGRSFVLPLLDVVVELPAGWSARRGHGAVTSVSPRGDAALAVGLAGATSAHTAAQAFASDPLVDARPAHREGACWMRDFTRRSEDGAAYRGLACFVERDGRVFRIVGYAREEVFDRCRPEMMRAIASLGPAGASRPWAALRRLQVLDVGPLRLAELARAFPSDVSSGTIALLNGLDPSRPDAVLPQPMKRVVLASAE
jgi:predicted Zn-dependent protease